MVSKIPARALLAALAVLPPSALAASLASPTLFGGPGHGAAVASVIGAQSERALASLVQLLFSGDGGGAVQIDVVAGGRALSLPMHFAPGTGAADITLAFTSRLANAGVATHGPSPGGTSIFLDGVSRVAAYASGGTRVSLAAVDGAVSAVRFQPMSPEAPSNEARLCLSTVSPHDGSRGEGALSVPLEPGGGAPGASARVHEAASAAGWNGDRPGGSGWRPVRDKGGRDVVGLSASVQRGGWQVVLEL